MNHLTYKGYTAAVEFDADEGILYGRVLDLRDVITFQSENATDIVQEFHTSVDEYLAFCKEQGIEPAKPYSGKLPFRTTPMTHRKIALAAAAAGKSINSWMEETLTAAADATIASRILKTAPRQGKSGYWAFTSQQDELVQQVAKAFSEELWKMWR